MRRSNRRGVAAAALLATLVLAGCTQASAPPEPTAATAALVVGVTDGDTIIVRIGDRQDRVRYIGIDAPEEGEECLAAEATEANRALVDGATVHLERDVSDRDPFDRLLRYVWLDTGDGWRMANRELVRQGLALARVYPPDDRYATTLAADEAQARRDGRGIWGEC